MEGDFERSTALAGVVAGAGDNATSFNFNPVSLISNFSDGSLQSLIPFPSSDFLTTFPASSSSSPSCPTPSFTSFSFSSNENLRLLDHYYNFKYQNQRRHHDPTHSQPFDTFSCFNLPGLRSLESPSENKRLPKNHPSSFASDQAVLSRQLTRQRRQKNITQKTHCLEKLMPWNKKMDTATLLEEARKYVRFLQAQVKVLQTMPVHSSFNVDDVFLSAGGGDFGVLETLSRQQLLEVLLSSPAAQSRLYSQGLCVYSIEQLVLLKKVAERELAIKQMMFGGV